MNEITKQTIQLPDTLEDLARFTLIGRERLTAVRAEIRAIEKVGLAKEVHEQKLAEAQEIAEAVLDAEVKIGELTRQMEKAKNQYDAKDTAVHSTKAAQLEQIGISEKQKQRYETLAAHPEVVEQAKTDARENGEVVTRADVLNRIAPPKTHKENMRDIKERAKEEHQAFTESTIVSMEDVKNDKDNVELLALDTLMTVERSISMVNSLAFMEDELKLMGANMDQVSKRDLTANAQRALRTLTHIMRIIGG